MAVLSWLTPADAALALVECDLDFGGCAPVAGMSQPPGGVVTLIASLGCGSAARSSPQAVPR